MSHDNASEIEHLKLSTRPRPSRSDAKRNLEQVLESARHLFERKGVDTPVREIAAHAGLGIGTIYRHFPKRGDLIAAVYKDDIDALAAEATRLKSAPQPFTALATWSLCCARFFTQKPGLATALRSNEPTMEALPDYFLSRLIPPLRQLLNRCYQAGNGEQVIQANDLVCAISSLAIGAGDDEAQMERTVKLIIDGIARQVER